MGVVRAATAILILCPVSYIVIRAVLAQRRGEDAGKAVLSAIRVVGPPTLVAVVGLFGLAILFAFAVVALILAFGASLGDDEQAGNLLLVYLGGVAMFLLAFVGAVVWGLVRVVRASRKQAGNP